ncbi:MAG TPA: DUF1697 domain-containing protein [Hyphomonadaceae bacterium]|jgi:uncharacterized protein (DUF1697 family)|nr:DUF1697 domain-containing protein [Hyphomonadaceae bacterium]
MPIRIALLRSMVISRHRVTGADVEALAEAASGTDARAVMATGNVLFRSRRSPATLAKDIEAACKARFGQPTEIIVKTGEEWRALVAANPFKAAAKKTPNRVLVWIMREPVPPNGISQLRRRAHASEQITRLASGDFYIHLGMPNRDDTKLVGGFGLNHIGAVGTNRTWTTVAAITKALEEMEEQGH